MIAANVYTAIVKYRDFHKWATIVEQAGLSAIHHSCSEFMVSEFQTRRGFIQSIMEKNLRLKLEGNEETGEEGVNAVAVSLQLTYIGLPQAYNMAVAEKQVSSPAVDTTFILGLFCAECSQRRSFSFKLKQAAEEDIALAIAQRKQETTKGTVLFRASISTVFARYKTS